jgi:eukaryotic-like serine/threonine-protein kinase
MSPQPPDWWQEVTTYLDQALEMPETERSAWLQTLHEENPALVAQLQTLLDEHSALKQEGFLEVGAGPEFRPQVPAHQTIDAYTLLSPAGQGGMGSVWLAERNDGRFERQVAVKFLSVGLVGRGVEERFKREGSILGRLAHPHIAELVDAGVSATGQPYLVLEYVDGKHIDEYCDEHELDVQARVSLFLDVLAAVEHAHTHLIVHRDLKPSNVLVRKDGQVKLLDFGIAKLLEGEGESGAATMLTRDGGAALTPEYAAPEQITGRPVTTATDVYALGVLLYVLLTGRHPAGVNRTSPAELVKAITETEPPSMSGVVEERKAASDLDGVAAIAEKRGTTSAKLSKQLRGDLDTIVAKALKKNPEERYASVVALADDLRRTLRNEPISARPDSVGYRATKFVRRNRTTVTLAALALLALVAGVTGTLAQARTARAQRDFAYRALSQAEATNDLNSFLLSDAAPSGKPFTVNELLGRAEHTINRGRTITDVNRVNLLVSIGMQYSTQDEAGKAREILERAYKLSQGVSDNSTRAFASCALAASLTRDGDFPRAESLFQSGIQQLPEKPEFALDRTFCFLRGSEVAREGGDARQGIARAEAAQKALRQSPLPQQGTLAINTSIDLAESYRTAGQNREAGAAFEQAALLLTATGRDETETAVVLFNNWGMALNQLGHPIEADKVYRRAIEISRAGQTEEAVSPMVLNNYAKVLRDLGRLDEAADYAERAYAKAQKAGHQLVINQSLLERAVIYRERKEFTRAAAMLAEVEPRLRRSLPPGHYAFGSLASQEALVALGRGEQQLANRLADQAVAIDEAAIKAGGEGSDYLPTVLLRRCTVEIAGGRSDAAVADANRALNMLLAAAQPGAFSSVLGRAYLTLGRALQGQGKPDQARTAFRSAAEQLQSAVGPDHPDTRAAVELSQTGLSAR